MWFLEVQLQIHPPKDLTPHQVVQVQDQLATNEAKKGEKLEERAKELTDADAAKRSESADSILMYGQDEGEPQSNWTSV